MLARPRDLPDSSLVDAVTGWGLDVASVEYLPVGFGSHHWRIVDSRGASWFATVDDLRDRLRGVEDSIEDARARLRAALVTARALADAGAAFVVAPIRRPDGEVLGAIGEKFAVAIYPYVDGHRDDYGDVFGPDQRHGVMAVLAELHATDESTRRTAMVETFEVQLRQSLLAAIDDLGKPWDTGPYGERTRELLVPHVALIERLLARHDRLAAEGRSHPDRMVLTHGEPHPGNLIETGEGWRLVDWDTALLAPPERDLWDLDSPEDPVGPSYAELTGRVVRQSMLDYYRAAWALNDIAAFVSEFHQPHSDGANQREGWNVIVETLNQLTT